LEDVLEQLKSQVEPSTFKLYKPKIETFVNHMQKSKLRLNMDSAVYLLTHPISSIEESTGISEEELMEIIKNAENGL
jgi:hypothetical protein